MESYKLETFFLEQIKLEQRFLTLNENQQNILLLCLESGQQMNAYDLRMKVYFNLLKYDYIKKTLIKLRNQFGTKDAEATLRKLAKKLAVSLPSNIRFKNDLKDLVNKEFVMETIRNKPKRQEFGVSPKFYNSWTKIKTLLVKAIEEKKISKNALTEQSKKFWQIL